jgi:hypothetical protein
LNPKLETSIRQTPEGEQFYRLYDALASVCERGQPREELTPAERETIREVSLTETRVAVNAQAALAALEHSQYVRVPERAEENTRKNLAPPTFFTQPEKHTIEQSELSVFPNPSQGSVSISYKAAHQEQFIEITNILGQPVRAFRINDFQGTIETSQLQTGVYFVILKNNGNSQLHRRLVVTP